MGFVQELHNILVDLVLSDALGSGDSEATESC